MPSKNSDGLSLLVRREPLTPEDWVKLVEARRALIKPCLDSISLPKLGTLGGKPPLYARFAGLVNYPAWQDIQGFFKLLDRRGIDEETNYQVIWGLTRSGEWLHATGIYARREDCWKECSIKIECPISTTSLLEKLVPDLGYPAMTIWQDLEECIRKAKEERQKLLISIEEIHDVMVREKIVFSLSPSLLGN